MLDTKIYTFLKLCDVMNYRLAAEALHITQPAVTRHIQLLEQEYNCRLFVYNGRKLLQTAAGARLEAYARSAVYNEQNLRQSLLALPRQKLRVGATKTIGDYVLLRYAPALVSREDICLSLIIDNTARLLSMLDQGEIDIALIEGFFDKSLYGYQLIRAERLVGLCAADHSFSGKEVPLTALFTETLIYREAGSGTRDIFEQLLHENNYSLEHFPHGICVSSFEWIKTLVREGCGISFVYESIAASDSRLGVFHIRDADIRREFNFVFLKDTDANLWIDYFRICGLEMET